MDKSKRFVSKSKRGFRKPKRFCQTSKEIIQKYKRGFRRRSPLIKPGDEINYRNMSLIGEFISRQGKILSRRVTKLTLKQQRLITIAIKQARILSSLPFLNNERLLEKIKSRNRKKFSQEKKNAPRKGKKFFPRKGKKNAPRNEEK